MAQNGPSGSVKLFRHIWRFRELRWVKSRIWTPRILDIRDLDPSDLETPKIWTPSI